MTPQSATLEFTILGSGSSGGVPRIDGNWGDCDPANPKNRRSRCSFLVRRKAADGGPETTIIVDTSPDLREQALAAQVRRLDAVLLTHDHADQVHGLDDVRAFALVQRARIDVHMDAQTRATLMQRFGYIFVGEGGYPAICNLHDVPAHGTPWYVEGPSGMVPITTFEQDHGAITSVGYRFGGPDGGIAYSSDVVSLDDAAFQALENLDVWVVDALRWTPHPTHAHVERTLEWIARAKPKRAILTNMHIDLDYEALKAKLPAGVEPAYDGLRFELEIDGASL